MSFSQIKLSKDKDESDIKIRAIFESLAEGLILIDERFRIVESNKSAEYLLESSRGELQAITRGTGRWQFYREDGKKLDPVDLPFRITLKTGKPVWGAILGIKNLSSEIIWLSMNSQAVYDESGKPKLAIVSFSDTSEQKWALDELLRNIEELQAAKDIIENKSRQLQNLNDKLQTSENELKLANAAKDKFFSIVAHDLKNPLLSLKDLSHSISAELDFLEKEEIKESLDFLSTSAESTFKLLENLLEWSRVQMGRMPYNPESFDLTAVSNLNIDIQSAAAKNKNITLLNKAENSVLVFADLNLTNTVIRNVLSNAIKFTPEGGKIEIKIEDGDREAIISIKDSGIGMDAEIIGKIFNVGSIQTSYGTKGEKGTGIGLPLCKELMEINKGDIIVNSKPGKGSTFLIYLPKNES